MVEGLMQVPVLVPGFFFEYRTCLPAGRQGMKNFERRGIRFIILHSLFLVRYLVHSRRRLAGDD
jgi:hypothetical protein